jgi:hypothetical protein
VESTERGNLDVINARRRNKMSEEMFVCNDGSPLVENLYLTSFYGGEKRGRCIQIDADKAVVDMYAAIMLRDDLTKWIEKGLQVRKD